MNNAGHSHWIFIHITSIVTHHGSLLPTHTQFYLFLNLSLISLLSGHHMWQRCTWHLFPGQSPKWTLLCWVTGSMICVCFHSTLIGYEICFPESHVLRLAVDIYVPCAAAFVLTHSPHGTLETDFKENWLSSLDLQADLSDLAGCNCSQKTTQEFLMLQVKFCSRTLYRCWTIFIKKSDKGIPKWQNAGASKPWKLLDSGDCISEAISSLAEPFSGTQRVVQVRAATRLVGA